MCNCVSPFSMCGSETGRLIMFSVSLGCGVEMDWYIELFVLYVMVGETEDRRMQSMREN